MRRVMVACLVGVVGLILWAGADENEPTSNPQITAPFPAEVAGGDCYRGIVEDNDPPLTVYATWDDNGGSVPGSVTPGGFGGHTVKFSFCPTPQDAGRSFTIRALDGSGNISTLTVRVL